MVCGKRCFYRSVQIKEKFSRTSCKKGVRTCSVDEVHCSSSRERRPGRPSLISRRRIVCAAHCVTTWISRPRDFLEEVRGRPFLSETHNPHIVIGACSSIWWDCAMCHNQPPLATCARSLPLLRNSPSKVGRVYMFVTDCVRWYFPYFKLSFPLLVFPSLALLASPRPFAVRVCHLSLSRRDSQGARTGSPAPCGSAAVLHSCFVASRVSPLSVAIVYARSSRDAHEKCNTFR